MYIDFGILSIFIFIFWDSVYIYIYIFGFCLYLYLYFGILSVFIFIVWDSVCIFIFILGFCLYLYLPKYNNDLAKKEQAYNCRGNQERKKNTVFSPTVVSELFLWMTNFESYFTIKLFSRLFAFLGLWMDGHVSCQFY